MTHLDSDPPVASTLDALLTRTLGSGELSAARKRRHRERLGLTVSAFSGHLSATRHVDTPDDSGSRLTVTSTTSSGSFRSRLELITVASVLILVLAGVVLYQSLLSDDDSTPAIGGPHDAGYGLYLLETERNFQPLNAATLENLDDAEMLELYPWSWFALSVDGSTMATIEYSRRILPPDPNLDPGEVEIVIADGLTGRERVRFHPPEHVHDPVLSNDGSRLLVQGRVEFEIQNDPVWYVFDTSDGTLLGSIEGEGQYGIGLMYFSADATQLYSTVNGWTGSEIVSGQFQIRVYDVVTGAEIDRLTLADIPVGAWSNDSGSGSATVQDLQPAVALSPDARTIAIVHVHEDAITLIDVETLTVRSTIEYAPGDGSIEHWLQRDISQDNFAISFGSYIYRGASFSPNGRYLYVHGQGQGMAANQQYLVHGFGLTVVDIETGETIATSLVGEYIMYVTPAPDGRSVYVIRDDREEVNDEPRQTILRLDAHTLDILAERTVDSHSPIIIGLDSQSDVGTRSTSETPTSPDESENAMTLQPSTGLLIYTFDEAQQVTLSAVFPFLNAEYPPTRE